MFSSDPNIKCSKQKYAQDQMGSARKTRRHYAYGAAGYLHFVHDIRAACTTARTLTVAFPKIVISVRGSV